jgi:antitoxin component YwqK of YwqJK toxin-antitoxin module
MASKIVINEDLIDDLLEDLFDDEDVDEHEREAERKKIRARLEQEWKQVKVIPTDSKTNDGYTVIKQYPNGNKKEGKKTVNGKVIVIKWFPTGQSMELSVYVNGQLDGEHTTWHDNGQIDSKESYKNGELNGESKSWYDNRQIAKQESYKNGILNGERKTWYDNGQLQTKETYRDGKPEGESESWYEDGRPESYSVFENGIMVKGDEWDENGVQTPVEIHDGTITINMDDIDPDEKINKDFLIDPREKAFMDEYDNEYSEFAMTDDEKWKEVYQKNLDKIVQSHRQYLSPEKIKQIIADIVWNFTESKADSSLNYYTGLEGYRKMNELLRRGNIPLDPTKISKDAILREPNLEHVIKIDGIMRNNGSLKDIVLFRGLTNLPQLISEQGILVNKAYTSCSYWIREAYYFAKGKSEHGHCCIMKFTIPDEIKYCDLYRGHGGLNKGEKEVIIQRNTQFVNFVSLGKNQRGYHVYSCTLKLYAMPIVTEEDKLKQDAL